VLLGVIELKTMWLTISIELRNPEIQIERLRFAGRRDGLKWEHSEKMEGHNYCLRKTNLKVQKLGMKFEQTIIVAKRS